MGHVGNMTYINDILELQKKEQKKRAKNHSLTGTKRGESTKSD